MALTKTDTDDDIDESIQGLGLGKSTVNDIDIFNLAKAILLICACLYILFALIRVFDVYNPEAVKEVWEYSKVILNSIVSLVLGVYFGSRVDSNKV